MQKLIHNKQILILFFIAYSTISCSSQRNRPTLSYQADCGYIVNQKLCSIELPDQYNDIRNITEFNDSVTVLQFSTMWCHACTEAAYESANIKKIYESSLTYAIILLDSYDVGVDPTHDDVFGWAQENGIAGPVLQGSSELIDTKELNGFGIDMFPTFYIIGKNNTILAKLSDGEDLVYYVNKLGFGQNQKDMPAPPEEQEDNGCLPSGANE